MANKLLRKIIIIDPRLVKKLSAVTGCSNSRQLKIIKYNYHLDGDRLNGDWDQGNCSIEKNASYLDFLLYKRGGSPLYPWGPLYDVIRDRGYVQDPNKRYVEIGIGRNGDYYLADGRHRLIIAQDLGIRIPVEVIYIHTQYQGVFDDRKGI